MNDITGVESKEISDERREQKIKLVRYLKRSRDNLMINYYKEIDFDGNRWAKL